MADTSGSFRGNGVTGRDNHYFMNWQLAGQETGNNRSLINWQAYAHFNSSDSQLNNGVANSNVGQLWANGGRVKNYDGNIATKDVMLASGSFWIPHSGTGVGQLQLGGGVTFYGGGRSEGTSGVWTLPQINRQAYLTNLSQDINDLANPWVEFSNPAGYPVNVWIEAQGARRLQRNGVGSRYTWSLTEAERNMLRGLTPNSNTMAIRYVVETNVNGSYMHDWQDRVYSITDGNPTFTDFTYKDINPSTLAITGDDQYMIQGASSLELTIVEANKATARKQATMNRYNAVISNINKNITFSSSDIVDTLGTVGANTDTNLAVRAIDSRGNGTTVNKMVKVLPYIPPQITATANRVNNFETATNIHIEGVISRITVNDVDKNTVNNTSGIRYRYKKTTDTTWSAWVNRSSSTSSGNVSVTDFSVNLDRNYAWNVEFSITDRINTVTTSTVVSVGIPLFRIGLDGRIYNNEKKIPTEDDDLVYVKQNNLDLSSFTGSAINGASGLPMKNRSVAMGFGTTAMFTRVGNLVLCNMNTVTSFMSSGDILMLVEKMPVGYRPMSGYEGMIVANSVIGGTRQMGWSIANNGDMTLSNTNTISGPTRIYGSGAWFTSDAWT